MIRYKNYVIEANEWGGFVLCEVKERGSESKNKGEKYLVNLGYPSTLKGCFNKILGIEFAKGIKEKDLTIREALNELEKINKELTNEFEIIKEEIE